MFTIRRLTGADRTDVPHALHVAGEVASSLGRFLWLFAEDGQFTLTADIGETVRTGIPSTYWQVSPAGTSIRIGPLGASETGD